MNPNDRSLGDLLKDATPAPPRPIDFDALAPRVQRRRTATAVAGGAGAVLAIAATFAAATQFDRTPVAKPNLPIAADGGTPTASPNDAGCPPTKKHPNGQHVMVDYVPFIVLEGQQFVSQLDEVPPMSRDDLGEQVATVTCRIADLTEDSSMGVDAEFPSDFADGNAAYLQVGTPIYAVAGFSPSCRVAVIEDGTVVAYLAHHEVDNHSVPMDCAITPSDAPHSQPVDASRVTVWTHCGVQSTYVKGELWLADPPLGDHNPPAGWNDPSETGTFTITGTDSAEFRTDSGQTATFVRAAPGADNPNTGCK